MTMDMDIITLPDTLRDWPWKRSVNPHYEECKAASSAWCDSFHAFSPKAQKAFNRCDFNLLASMAFARLNKEGCRIGCDLMNLFFVFDEYSDVADDKETRRQADIIMDALRNPQKSRPSGEWIGGEITRQYWLNAIKTATPSAQRRFVETFRLYTDSVVQQSADRTHHYIRSIDSYFEVRRDTIGAKPSFAINEVHLNLPDYVLDDPTIKSLTACCIDMLIIGNDLCSYNVEQARGDDGHNLVTIVMNQLRLDLHGALDWISKLHDNIVAQFLADFKKIPSWGEPIDSEVAIYADGLGNWVRANDQWSFESQRYFGKDGLKVLRERKIRLLPKNIESAAPLVLSETETKRQTTNSRSRFVWVAWLAILVLTVSEAVKYSRGQGARLPAGWKILTTLGGLEWTSDS